MKKLLFYYFLFCFITGITIYVLQFFVIALPNFINFYANDFFIIPIVLYLSLVVLRWSRNNNQFQISLPHIIYLCSLYAILFEFILPIYLARYTKDIFDIIIYFASGIAFYGLQKLE